MFKINNLFLFSLFINLNISNLLANQNQVEINSNPIKTLDWEYSDLNIEEELNWYEDDANEIFNKQIKIKNIGRKMNIFSVRSTGKGVTVNGFNYPDISNYVPNAFVADPNKSLGLSTRAISKTRFCNGENFSKGWGSLGVLFNPFIMIPAMAMGPIVSPIYAALSIFGGM